MTLVCAGRLGALRKEKKYRVAPTNAVNVGRLTRVSGFQSLIGSLASTVESVDQCAKRGIAAVAAMTTASMPPASGSRWIPVQRYFTPPREQTLGGQRDTHFASCSSQAGRSGPHCADEDSHRCLQAMRGGGS